MSNLFQKLELEAFRKGITPRTQESRNWFRRRVQQLTRINREALMREKSRGGQSFFVVPRIADMDNIISFLENEVPEINFKIAHGQLVGRNLDNVIEEFINNKIDLLLSTSIVESGLDFPNANTLIVHRANMFGLSQLYQIRGRVGRSKMRAY